MRRQELAIRTITVTLQSALETLAGDTSKLSREEREGVRRGWCARAREALGEIRGEVERSRALVTTLAREDETSRREVDLDSQLMAAEGFVDRLERVP